MVLFFSLFPPGCCEVACLPDDTHEKRAYLSLSLSLSAQLLAAATDEIIARLNPSLADADNFFFAVVVSATVTLTWSPLSSLTISKLVINLYPQIDACWIPSNHLLRLHKLSWRIGDFGGASKSLAPPGESFTFVRVEMSSSAVNRPQRSLCSVVHTPTKPTLTIRLSELLLLLLLLAACAKNTLQVYHSCLFIFSSNNLMSGYLLCERTMLHVTVVAAPLAGKRGPIPFARRTLRR